MSRRSKAPEDLDGSKWRRTHQATVDGVLSHINETRKVRSQGSMFFNQDSWTARAFTAALCEWARLNPASAPDRYDIEDWVQAANRAEHSVGDSNRGITIASTPDDLPRWLAFALVGGGYHEAWHTLYSRRTAIHIKEVMSTVQDLWKLVPYAPHEGKKGWAGLTKALLDWSNVIEDIRIERLGCKQFPGSPAKMEALQDLILKQEREGREAASLAGVPTNDALSVVMATFRDVGLGYETPDQDAALRGCQERSPEGYRFVTEGPLKPLLARAIALGPEADLDCLWLAMEVVAAIVKASEAPQEAPKPQPAPEDSDEDEEEQEGEQEGQGTGQGEPQEPQEQGQQDAYPEDEPDDSSQDGKKAPPQKKGPELPPLYKKGDRAKLKAGPYAGREVEVTRASLPHPETGVQNLEFALIEED